ncbi:MAG: rhomboid family intramembrane serine protease, partial [Actinobacteria bacterium]|nr:rhomboid family intramembrane serine protease [Actinomycetota bacterium]
MRLRAQSLTTLLVGLIALSYLIQLLHPGYEEALWISGAEYQQGQYWRLFTVALVHGGFLHLGFNLYALHILGTPVEQFFGRTRYIIILLVSLFFGSLASALFNNPYIASVGASGMVFGLFGALALISARVGVEWRGIIGIVLINFALGFIIGGVDWRAHVGGLLGGTLTTLILNRTK